MLTDLKLVPLIDDVTSDLDSVKYDYVQMASVDFSKAFDKLEPKIVLDKMRELGVNENILDIIKNQTRLTWKVKFDDNFNERR